MPSESGGFILALCNMVLHHGECNPVPHYIVASFSVYLCLCKSTLYVMTIWCATSWNCGNSHLYIFLLSCNIHLSLAWSFAAPACSCYILMPSSLFQTWQNWWKRDEIAERRDAAGEQTVWWTKLQNVSTTNGGKSSTTRPGSLWHWSKCHVSQQSLFGRP